MKTHWFEKSFKYDGTQLKSLFAYLETGLLGDSIVSWRGPCEVRPSEMVDGEDFRENQEIRGSDMVHFIVEVFPGHLAFAVGLQRILTTIVRDVLYVFAPSQRGQIEREGDDLYLTGRKKFSISIATVSPVSGLIHFAINVSNEGTPVPTASLGDLKIDPKAFSQEVLKRFASECLSIDEATKKVFSVR
jgi:uncharacterized protein